MIVKNMYDNVISSYISLTFLFFNCTPYKSHNGVIIQSRSATASSPSSIQKASDRLRHYAGRIPGKQTR